MRCRRSPVRTGFIGRSVVAGARSSEATTSSPWCVIRPSRVRSIRPRSRSREATWAIRRPWRGSSDGADGVIHIAGSYRVGIPASERPRCTRPTSRPPSACSTPRSPRRCRGSSHLDRQRLRQHARPDRRRDVPPRPAGRVHQLLRRDEVPRPRGGGATHRGSGRPWSSSSPGPSTGPATTRRSAPSSRPPTTGRPPSSRFAAVGISPVTSTTSRRASSPRWIADASARHTSWPGRTSGWATAWRSRPASAGPARHASCPERASSASVRAGSDRRRHVRSLAEPARDPVGGAMASPTGRLGQGRDGARVRPRDLGSGFADAFGAGPRLTAVVHSGHGPRPSDVHTAR